MVCLVFEKDCGPFLTPVRNEETGHEWKCVQHDTTSVVPSRTGNANELSLLKNGRDLEFYFPQGYVSDGAHVYDLPKATSDSNMTVTNVIIVLN